jgi:hypothetical protein
MVLLDFIGLFLFLSGFVVGLGAVTVIDIHGLLGRNSPYWTEATTRTHKVTKPMIWVGMFLCILGGVLFYRNTGFTDIPRLHALLAIVLVINGYFLSFKISPLLLQREKEGKSSELLPKSFQSKIILSLIVSDLGWWGALLLLVYYIITM